MTDVTVIVPSYNSGENLLSCVDSLKRQECDGIRYDVIVVDSSTDNTPDLMKEKHPDLRMIHSRGRLLPGAARNLGVKEVKSGLIAFIDSDCIAQKGWLSSLVNCINGSGSDVVGGAVKSYTGYHVFGAISYLTEFGEFMPGRHKGDARFVPSNNMICKRDVFEKARGFLEDRMSGEDRIFAESIRRMNGKIYFCPEAHIYHKDRKSFTSLIKHQASLGCEAARARKAENMEGGIFVRIPALTPCMPVLRLGKLFYRLLRYREYGYSVFAGCDAALILFAYCVWTLGFIKGIFIKQTKYEKL